jgi:fructan beta-fructosidase
MSNWQYADRVPTHPWRSAMTIPRNLYLEKIRDNYFVGSNPVEELNILAEKETVVENIPSANYDLTAKTGKLSGPAKLFMSSEKLGSFTVTLSNDRGEKVVIGYDQGANHYFIDRTNSGQTNFEKGFANKHTAPRLSVRPDMDMMLYIDNSSVELFADHGLSVMTEIFFPNALLSDITIHASGDFKVKTLKFSPLKSIWK